MSWEEPGIKSVKSIPPKNYEPGYGPTLEVIHYDAIVKCLNCGNQWSECIPHGKLVVEHIKDHAIKCLNCKCDDAKIVGGVTV